MSRLFKNDTLYCEGRPRPYFRGKMHLLCCATIFPSFIYYLWLEQSYSYVFAACFTNMCTIYTSHIVSSIYHIIKLPLKYEILIQKIDIIGLNWYICSNYYPIISLIPIGIYPFICITTACIYNSYTIWNSTYKYPQSMYLTIMQIPIGYYMYTYMTRFELYCVLSTMLIFICAGLIFISEISFKHINYFELYHALTVPCAVLCCTINYSIACRH